MEDSETQERLLCLGKKLEKNFEKNKNDEISVWMAHFIAQKMVEIDAAYGEAKAPAQRECFEAILILWNHQESFPYNIRPFKDFDPIFRALAHIDPNKTGHSFFKNGNEGNHPSEEAEHAIKFISSLDQATRIMISFFVRYAIRHATDKSTSEWLNAIDCVVMPSEAKVILDLVPELDNKYTTQDQNEKRKSELSEFIDKLEAFESLSRDIKSIFKAELESFEMK